MAYADVSPSDQSTAGGAAGSLTVNESSVEASDGSGGSGGRKATIAAGLPLHVAAEIGGIQ
jgi:hypothetical protein